MSKRPTKPDCMPWLSPYLIVKDPKVSVEFYQKAFGFEKGDCAIEEDGQMLHAEMKYKDQVIMIGKEGAHCNTYAPVTSGVASPVSLYLYVDDVDNFYKHAVEAGAKSKQAPELMFWGDKICNFTDPDGHSWSFGTNLEDPKH